MFRLLDLLSTAVEGVEGDPRNAVQLNIEYLVEGTSHEDAATSTVGRTEQGAGVWTAVPTATASRYRCGFCANIWRKRSLKG
jgi:hypothetical protein